MSDQDVTAEDDNIDGCELDFDEEITADDALPMAFGGVAIEVEGEDACGCDAVVDETEETADEDLPPAEGGVA